MDLIDKLLEGGSIFDWISPLVAAIQDVANGPHYTFLITDSAGMSGNELFRRLRQIGIGSWGHMIVNDTIMVTVKAADAARAYGLLNQLRVSTENDPATVPAGQGAAYPGTASRNEQPPSNRQPGGLAGLAARLEKFWDS